MVNIMYKFKRILIHTLCILISFSAYQVQAITPYLSVIDGLSFGELTGFSGTCSLDYSTKEVTLVSGTLCPFSGTKYGTPGKFILFGNPNKIMRIRIKNKPNTGDGLSYTPAGVYSVSGQPDVVITSNIFQLINTGSTGLIIINLGGTFSNVLPQELNSSFDIVIEEAIQFTEQ